MPSGEGAERVGAGRSWCKCWEAAVCYIQHLFF